MSCIDEAFMQLSQTCISFQIVFAFFALQLVVYFSNLSQKKAKGSNFNYRMKISQIMENDDTNEDGMISFTEFSHKGI